MLPTNKSAKKLFWYDSKEHERMLYADYIDFMDRTGFDPPRCVVEDNIAEIATRIRIRENMLCTRVQKRWRGLLTRRIIVLYRSECLWLRQWREGRSLAIQRMYRGHAARLKLLKYIYDSIAQTEHTKYKNWRKEKKFNAARSLAKELTKSAYLKERAEEKTARFTERVPHSKTKMKDFAESCYGDDRLAAASLRVAANEHTALQRKEKERRERQERREFLMNRIAEHGPHGYGRRGFAPEIQSLYSAEALSALEAASTDPRTATATSSSAMADKSEKTGVSHVRESSRSHGMRSLFKDELGVLTAQVVEDSSNDATLSPKSRQQQFQEHNKRTDLPQFKNYKYPADINTDKMAVLYEEIPRTRKKKK